MLNIEISVNLFSFLLFFFSAIILCIFLLTISYILGGKSQTNRSKNIPFESGVNPIGNTKLRFSAKFYLIAMFFVIFDVESLYLYAWSITVIETSWKGFIEATIFIFFQLISLIYIVRIGAFDWAPKKNFKLNMNNY